MEFNEMRDIISFLVEGCAYEGVKRVAGKVAIDAEKVCGIKPKITDRLPQEAEKPLAEIVLFATLDNSPLTESLIREGKYDPSKIRGKREVYQIQFLDNPFPGIGKALLICGSDKRGTIYGMFALSEFIGVSPLHYWGDAEPVRRERIELTPELETVSKEPSVKYRGFFINDEWPCFGNWAFSHFNGVNADMYEHVFELLLRLKGNYIWPAMWKSSFPLDGPGCLNEELADIYGVIVGASHHEPCLRASEEWAKVKGSKSRYGNEWNYYTNREGLLNYWEDSLKRSGKYGHIITIGMRGEHDSSMLGDDSSMKDNIELLKDIITNQRRLIKEHVNPDIDAVPQLLALYKEVEAYFYGDENTAGLKDWEELDRVICMLCEDNFGFMRTLPTADMKNRPGGFGMYYHFDYHGGPISYEWMTSTPFSKTWEQMCMAYDYGIRDIWIVNVGDLKFNEVPLAYFMTLAYDFESWGTGAPNSHKAYTQKWLKETFPSVGSETREKMAYVLEEYIRVNGMRRPETLNSTIYHPCHYLESDRMLGIAREIEKANEEIYENLSNPAKDAYYSMIYFPAKSSINLLRMHLYAGKNAHYAAQGKPIANEFARMVTECIETDRTLASELAAFKQGKWKGMELEQHIGFTKWNDFGYKYPLRISVEPVHKPRMIVSRKDSEIIASKNYGFPEVVRVDDFVYEGNTEVILEIANDGIGSFEYIIEPVGGLPVWLTVSPVKGYVEMQQEVYLLCDRSKLPKETETARLLIRDGDTTVAVEISGKAVDTAALPSGTYLQNRGVIAMQANRFCKTHETPRGRFLELEDYGRSGCGMKVFPTDADFSESETQDKPSLTYRFLIEQAGEYEAEIWLTPTNPVKYMAPMRFMLSDSCGGNQILEAVPADFKAGVSRDHRWSNGVLCQIRIVKTRMTFDEGICELTISPLETGLVLERILLYRKECAPKASYLGPKESFFKS